MERIDKEKAVAELHEKMARAAVGIVTQIKGIDVETVTELRKQLREQSVDFKVVKNTLAARRQGNPHGETRRRFHGSRGACLQLQDPVTPAKVLTKFVKALPPERAEWLKIKAGVLSGKRLDADGVAALSSCRVCRSCAASLSASSRPLPPDRSYPCHPRAAARASGAGSFHEGPKQA